MKPFRIIAVKDSSIKIIPAYSKTDALQKKEYYTLKGYLTWLQKWAGDKHKWVFKLAKKGGSMIDQELIDKYIIEENPADPIAILLALFSMAGLGFASYMIFKKLREKKEEKEKQQKQEEEKPTKPVTYKSGEPKIGYLYYIGHQRYNIRVRSGPGSDRRQIDTLHCVGRYRVWQGYELRCKDKALDKYGYWWGKFDYSDLGYLVRSGMKCGVKKTGWIRTDTFSSAGTIGPGRCV